jgi:hypothetical protein
MDILYIRHFRKATETAELEVILAYEVLKGIGTVLFIFRYANILTYESSTSRFFGHKPYLLLSDQN